jgi:beta-galactosidase
VTLEHRGDFRDSGWLRAEWEVTSDGTPVAGGALPMPALAPDARTAVEIPGFVPPPAGGERWLTLRFLTASATDWAPEGFEVGWAQVALDDEAGAADVDGAAVGDWTGDVPLDDEGRLAHSSLGAPPALALWRAPTDNDRIGGMADRWTGWGLPVLHRRLDGIERGADAVTVRSTWTTAAGVEVPHVARLSRDAAGRIRVEETAEIPGVLADLPRVGTLLTFGPGHEDVTWFGRGPHETYPDRRRGARVGRWSSTVTGQLVPYVRPQENGGHADVRRLGLHGSSGGARIVLDRPRQVSALHVTAADLDAASHDVELRPRPETFVHLDAAHRGLGSASCGPDTLEAYIVGPGTYRWSWTLEPLEAPRA